MHLDRRIERLTTVARRRQQGAVVLEDIYDPHNAQAVFRSCDAMGIQRVCLIFAEEKPFNPRRIGKLSSGSANKWLSFEIFDSTQACLDQLHAEQYEVIATVLADDSESLYELDLPRPLTAIMLGNEHRGLSETAVELADRKLMIPMRGMVQSLNLSVTAALCLYELTRQRLARGIEPYLLDEQTGETLAEEFLERG